jgi:hypothetical protein
MNGTEKVSKLGHAWSSGTVNGGCCCVTHASFKPYDVGGMMLGGPYICTNFPRSTISARTRWPWFYKSQGRRRKIKGGRGAAVAVSRPCGLFLYVKLDLHVRGNCRSFLAAAARGSVAESLVACVSILNRLLKLTY